MLWHRLRKNKLAMSGAAILLVLYLISCFGGFIGPYGSNEINKYTVHIAIDLYFGLLFIYKLSPIFIY